MNKLYVRFLSSTYLTQFIDLERFGDMDLRSPPASSWTEGDRNTVMRWMSALALQSRAMIEPEGEP